MDDPNFLAIPTKPMLPKERVAAIDLAIQKFQPTVLVIDGITDCVWDPNDQREGNEFYEKNLKRWADSGINVWCVIHESKDESLRGHVGKLVQRKCDSAIGVKAIGEDMVEVTMKLTRGQKPDAFSMRAGQNGILYCKEMPAYNFNLAGQNIEEPVIVSQVEMPKPNLDEDIPF
jgi:hypothetical protein